MKGGVSVIFACISVRFKDGIPNVNFDERPTYHEMDPKVVAPKRLPKIGDTVLIKTIGMPQAKLIVDRLKDNQVSQMGGTIVGRAHFYDPVDNATPFADQNTAQGGLAPA